MGDSALTRRWTRDEYYRMADSGILGPDERVELIGGEILTRPNQSSVHATAVLLAVEALRATFGEGYDVRPRLPLALGATNEPEPDLAIVLGAPRDYRDAHPSTALLVVEVADGSLTFDRGVKKALYARVGIQEYWIVDPVDRVLEVLRRPAAGDYLDQRTLREHESIAPVARTDARIAVADLLP